MEKLLLTFPLSFMCYFFVVPAKPYSLLLSGYLVVLQKSFIRLHVNHLALFVLRVRTIAQIMCLVEGKVRYYFSKQSGLIYTWWVMQLANKQTNKDLRMDLLTWSSKQLITTLLARAYNYLHEKH